MPKRALTLVGAAACESSGVAGPTLCNGPDTPPKDTDVGAPMLLVTLPLPEGWPPSASQRTIWRAASWLPLGPSREGSCFWKLAAAWESRTRSWGRLGPATEGSTVARSSDRVEEYSASGALGVWNNPCSRK